MPHFRLETNIPSGQIPADLPKKLCKVLSKSLGQPLNYCVATVIGSVYMSWGGTDEPAAQATLMSVEQIGTKENIMHSKALFDLITEELNITSDRMYIIYFDVNSSNVGYNGTTLQALIDGE